MAEDFLPPIVATLVADIAPYVAGLTEAQVRMGAFVASQTTAMAGMGSAMQAEAAKASRSLAGMGVTAERTDAQVTTSSAGVARAMREVSNSAAVTGAKWNAEMAQMEAATAKLTANLEAQALKAEASIKGLGNAMTGTTAKADAGFLSKLGVSSKALVGVGVAAGVAAYETTKMAGDFEQATTKLVTSAGESADAINSVRQGMLAMAGEVGVSATKLGQDIYPIESAGYHAAAGLGMLKAAEQGAKAEGAEGVKVADALSSAMRDYYPHAQSAADVTRLSADVMSKFIGATSTGKLTFDQLAGSMHNILPTASTYQIKMEDVLGVLASMTVHGISAEQATENINHAIQKLASGGTDAMKGAMATIGVSALDVQQHLGDRGLAGTLQYLSEKVRNWMPPGSDKVILDLTTAVQHSSPAVQELAQKFLTGEITMAGYAKAAKGLDPISAKQAVQFATLAGNYHKLGDQQLSGAQVLQTYGGMMQKVTGDMTTLKVALMTTGENTDYTNESIKTIAASTADAQGNVKGWSEVQHSFNQKLAEAKAGLGALAIAIGTALLPALKPLIGALGDAARWLSEHKLAAEILAGVIGVGLVVALGAATAAMISFTIATLSNPITWIVIGIAWAIAVIIAWGIAWYNLITHWSTVQKYISGAWTAFINWGRGIWQDFAKFFESLWHSIAGFFTGIWSGVTGFLSGVWNDIAGTTVAAWNAIAGLLYGVWMRIVNATRPIWEPIVAIIKDIFSIIHSVVTIIVGLTEIALIATWKGIVAAAKFIWTPIAEFFTWLWRVVSDAFTSAWNAVSGWLADKWRSIVDFARPIWNGIVEAVSGPLRWTRDVIVGIWDDVAGFTGRAWNRTVDAVGRGVGGVLDWAGGLAGKVLDAIGDLGGVLWNAGVKLIAGLLDGIEHQFRAVKDFVSGIADWVSAHKGPLDKDATLLTPHGNAVMAGFLSGLKAGSGPVRTFLDTFTAGISTGANTTVGVSGFTGRIPAAVGSGGSGPVIVNNHVHVNVEGSVHSVASLRKEVQDAVLQHKYRNSSNGLG